jgi:hypothetical protein
VSSCVLDLPSARSLTVDPTEPLPDFLTVEEAAAILRIGRTAAYGLARQWRATDGKEGLPVVAFGRLLRVPRAALEAVAGGPLSRPVAAPETPVERDEVSASQAHEERQPVVTAPAPRRSADQPSLFAEA